MAVALDRFQLARGGKFLERLQVLGAAYAQAVTETGAPSGEVEFARRFLSDTGLYAGKLALGMVNDGALTDTWNNISGADGNSTADDAAISAVIPYVFNRFKDVL